MATKVLDQQKLETLLRTAPNTPAPRRSRRWMGAVGAVVLVGTAVGVWRLTTKAPAATYGTAPVRRTTIAKTINATGTLQAVTTVQVGTQVSGAISELYADFNSQVTKGQIIAKLDPSQLQAQLAQANATWLGTQAAVQSAQNNVLAADAAVQSAQANVDHADAALQDAQTSYERTQKLVEAGAAPAMNLPTAESALNQAKASKQQALAQLNQSKAQSQASRSQVNQAQAQSAQAKASVDVANVNLDHTVIKAPIDGVVVARNVDVGQTVAASLQAPTIFLIANDLTRMQVLANIDEADVGQLTQGSNVSFTVDAYPNDVFKGRVSQVRLAPTTVQNVVTYTAVIDVPNPDLKLKPGMTANVSVVVAESDNVLAIPSSALRFRPDTQTAAPAATPAAPGTKTGRGNRQQPTVYTVANGKLTAVTVQTGVTDGVRTEITGGALKEGDVVATPMAATGTSKTPAAPQGRSPFAGAGGGGRGVR